jgi:valyl-tRNA synthetase
MKTIPFKQVLIHPVIQTADGKRMSKNKGNGVDPIDMIEKYGADANRFWFTSIGIKGDQDVRFREDRLDEYKKFANKLWHTGRFVLAQLENYKVMGIDPAGLTLPDKWILHRYNSMLKKVNEGMNEYDFSEVARELYDFTWDYFCDWYLEIAKLQLAQEAEGGVQNPQTRRVLHTIFEGLMRAMHPIMPFITDELWSKTPKSILFQQLVSVMFAPYPREDDRFLNPEAEEKMSFLIRVIRSVRDIRQTYNVPASSEAEVVLSAADAKELAILEEGKSYIENRARVKPTIGLNLASPKKSARQKVGETTIYIPLAKLIDVEKSREKLMQRKQAVEKDIAKVKEGLERPGFKEKAPKEKVEAMEAQLATLLTQLDNIISQLAVLDEEA